MPEQLIVRGFQASDFSQGFGVCFNLSVELATSFMSRGLSNIMALYDSRGAYLMVFVSTGGLAAAY
jgi:hypothetical protein